jgi:hypothetical protein
VFTLSTLVSNGLLSAWELPENAMCERNFFYSNAWLQSFDLLPMTLGSGTARPATVRARVGGLIDQFVSGERLARMVRPVGHGMEPPFQRMVPPNRAVVEMRTEAVRTFGLMGTNTFVAISLETKDALLARKTDTFDPYKEHAATCRKWLARIAASEIDSVSEINVLIA